MQQNRLADQRVFPLDEENFYPLEGTERKQNFKVP